MKTLVTGGAGFIGSNLVRRLIDQGRKVVIADDFSRGTKRNLTDLGIPADFPPVDLRDLAQAREVIQETDTVFHLAARIGSINYLHGSQMNELEALQTNLVIDTNVFKVCQESNVRKLVYASSIAVYPIDLQQSPNVTLSEETLCYFNPDGGYGWAKLIGETQLGWIKNVDIGIARIFNIYGENSVLEESSHVIADLLRKEILYPKEEFIVWGDGKQSRDFLYISDCVDALLKLEEKASQPPVTVNIGSGETTSIGTLAEKILSLSAKNIKIVYDPTKPVGPLSRTAEISKAKAVLNWVPRISLEEGLSRTYYWIRRRLREA